MVPDPESVATAREAGLLWVSDERQGISRRRAGDGFTFHDPSGARIEDEESISRISSLAIPPAWVEVWISPSPRGHVQATGRDARGRKQYRYHARWREVRDADKYGRLIDFAHVLPRIRRRVDRDMRRRGMPREKVLAVVLRLLEMTLIRIGNEEYAKHNKSFGLTTLRNRHASFRGARVSFTFRGKSGRDHTVGIRNQKLANVIKRCEELPGQRLFQYRGEDGELRPVDSDDVNAYLRDVSGQDFTAKDFRTWAGTVLAAKALQEYEQFDSEAQAKKNVVAAIEVVARRLGNTRSVCRKCYVHPAIVDSYMEGEMLEMLQLRAEDQLTGSLRRLKPEEAAVLALLQQRLKREAMGRRRPAARAA